MYRFLNSDTDTIEILLGVESSLTCDVDITHFKITISNKEYDALHWLIFSAKRRCVEIAGKPYIRSLNIEYEHIEAVGDDPEESIGDVWSRTVVIDKNGHFFFQGAWGDMNDIFWTKTFTSLDELVTPFPVVPDRPQPSSVSG